MEKVKIKIDKCEGMEVYCLRNSFGYDCENTPNNCTECPLMHFLYHDLTTNTLADESAAELTALVEKSGAFSGEYDGCNELPPEVWAAIYAIRKAFFDWDHATDGSAFFYEPESDLHKRFLAWFGKHGTIQGLPVGRFAVKTALNEIYTGRWLVMEPGSKEQPAIEEYSGTFKPVVFDDAADGIRYFSDILLKKAKNSHKLYDCGFYEPSISVSISPADQHFQRIMLRVEPHMDAVLRNAPMSFEDRNDFVSLRNKLFCCMEKVDDLTASTFRNRYLNRVAERQPGILFEANPNDLPKDPNHPTNKELETDPFFDEED